MSWDYRTCYPFSLANSPAGDPSPGLHFRTVSGSAHRPGLRRKAAQPLHRPGGAPRSRRFHREKCRRPRAEGEVRSCAARGRHPVNLGASRARYHLGRVLQRACRSSLCIRPSTGRDRPGLPPRRHCRPQPSRGTAPERLDASRGKRMIGKELCCTAQLTVGRNTPPVHRRVTAAA